MSYTLLDITQEILSSLSSDEVNSISDTTESLQIATIVRRCYLDLLARANLPEHKKLFTLDSSGDSAYPVLMTRPDNVRKIEWIKYNNLSDGTDNFEYVTILPEQQFMDRIHMLNTNDSDVDTFILNSVKYYYKIDKTPQFCTVVDDVNVVFDSFDQSIDTTLQTSKTLCFGDVLPTFTMSDTYVPDLDAIQFPLLINEAKSLASLELKQIAHEQAVQQTKRLWSKLPKSKSLVDKPSDFGALPYYGRK